jgi:type IV secretory pathway ATPase VirB11/archaellum biosynthesis ATPase
VPFEAREGTGERGPDGRRLGEVTLTELVEQSLVMNVSRVWLGEVRGEEAWPLIEVMEAGEGGSACTLHARSARHAFERLANLCMRGRAAVTPSTPTGPVPPRSTWSCTSPPSTRGQLVQRHHGRGP